LARRRILQLKEFREFSVLENLPKQSSFMCIYNNKRSEFCTMVTNESVQYKVNKETVRETLQVRKTKQRTGTTIKEILATAGRNSEVVQQLVVRQRPGTVSLK
jgi:hypothetical protein